MINQVRLEGSEKKRSGGKEVETKIVTFKSMDIPGEGVVICKGGSAAGETHLPASRKEEASKKKRGLREAKREPFAK